MTEQPLPVGCPGFASHAHGGVSGVAHAAFEDEESCLRAIRELLAFLPSNNIAEAPLQTPQDSPNRMDETLANFLPMWRTAG